MLTTVHTKSTYVHASHDCSIMADTDVSAMYSMSGILGSGTPGAELCRFLCCSDLTERHRRLAEIIEMIHTASLVHDDVLDEADTRRGEQQHTVRTALCPVTHAFAPVEAAYSERP